MVPIIPYSHYYWVGGPPNRFDGLGGGWDFMRLVHEPHSRGLKYLELTGWAVYFRHTSNNNTVFFDSNSNNKNRDKQYLIKTTFVIITDIQNNLDNSSSSNSSNSLKILITKTVLAKILVKTDLRASELSPTFRSFWVRGRPMLSRPLQHHCHRV